MDSTADAAPPTDPDGWTPSPDAGPMRDEMLLHDPSVISEVTHPIRGRLLRHLRLPRSAAELAEVLDVPITRLYHHLNRLETFELISIVSTRKVGAATERRYRASASSYRIPAEALTDFDAATLGTAMGAVFDLARLEFQREIEDGDLLHEIIAGGAGGFDERVMLSLGSLRLSTQRQRELVERLTALLQEFGDEEHSGPADSSDGDPAEFITFIAAFPTKKPTN